MIPFSTIQTKTRKKLPAFPWLFLGFLLFSGSTLRAQTSLLTYHNDQARDGWNQNESTLTTANVNSTNFGKLFSNAVDGQIYAQPLYVPNVNIGGGTHNVVYVVTEHDSAYAFDADSAGVTYWHVSFLNAATTITSVPAGTGLDINCTQITPEIGITDTPVIDPATGTIYFTAMTKQVLAGPVTNFYHQLHALDITTGAEKFNGPVTIQAVDPKNAAVTFIAKAHKERCALALSNGVVYTSWTSHCDLNTWGAYHGWVIGYNAANISQQMSVYNTTPTGTNPEGSLWESGDGPSVDASGNLYYLTSNGDFDQTAPVTDYGQCFLKLNTTGNAVTVLDYFSPTNEATLSGGDQDIGSAGQCLLPASWGSAAHPNLMLGADKPGDIYVVDTANMGHYSATTNNIPQMLVSIGGRGYTTPAIYSNGVTNYVYWGMTASTLKCFTFANGVYNSPFASQSTATFGGQGCVPSVSSNGNSNGIVWGLANGTPVVLHAYDATNLGTELYNSGQNAARDSAVGAVVKFAPPSIVNGKVYVPTANSLVVYGLLITPTFTPTGSFTATLTFTPTRTNTAANSPTNSPTRTATNTPSRTPTASPTNSPSATASPSPTNTFTQTGTNSPTRTPTTSPTNTVANTATNTPVNTATRTPTTTPTNTVTATTTNSPTRTPSATASPSPTNSFTQTGTNSPTNTALNTATRTPTTTTTNSPTNSATATASRTPTASPTQTGTTTPTTTPTRTATNSLTPTPSNSPSTTPTSTISDTPSATASPSPTNTVTQTGTNTPIITNTPSNTPTLSPTSTSTNSPTRTASSTPSATPSLTPTNSTTNTFTLTWTNTVTLTVTKTASNTPTDSATPSPSPTFTNTVTLTTTRTATQTPTASPTFTLSNVPTFTQSFTQTATATSSLTLTNTSTSTPSFTFILSNTWTSTPTWTNTHTGTPTPTATITSTASPTFTPSNIPTFTPTPSSVPVLYPNPAPVGGSTTLQITLSASSDIHYRIFTVSFRKVQNQTIPNVPAGLNKLNIPLLDKTGAALANGLYYLVINYDGNRVVLKLLVMG